VAGPVQARHRAAQEQEIAESARADEEDVQG
jgi:hypothetical protein